MTLMLVALAVSACTTTVTRYTVLSDTQISHALEQYRQCALQTDADCIVNLLADEASISHGNEPPHIGREAISAFLHSFDGVRVLSYDLPVYRIDINGEQAQQFGHYQQLVKTPDGQLVHVKGSFVATWQISAQGQLRLKALHTAPL